MCVKKDINNRYLFQQNLFTFFLENSITIAHCGGQQVMQLYALNSGSNLQEKRESTCLHIRIEIFARERRKSSKGVKFLRENFVTQFERVSILNLISFSKDKF